MIIRRIMMSINYKSAINDSRKLYVNEVEGRVGFFF
jgi:hypothetical protein